MKKEVTCSFTATIVVEVDIPENLLDVFEDNDDYSFWYPENFTNRNELVELYEIMNNEICKNLNSLDWEDIEVITSNDIEE